MINGVRAVFDVFFFICFAFAARVYLVTLIHNIPCTPEGVTLEALLKDFLCLSVKLIRACCFGDRLFLIYAAALAAG